MPSDHPQACALCGRATTEALAIRRFSAFACPTCARRLGRMLGQSPQALGEVWPALWERPDEDEDEDEGDEPEPQVQLPDGRMVDLRERTQELKRELPLTARMELAGTYGELGMHRAQLLEAGFVLEASEDPELSARALELLLTHRFTAPDVLDRLRRVLFPS